MPESEMTAAHAADIADGLAASGIRAWVMGGWGIDALLGRPTRSHHDLDLLVCAADLPALFEWLGQQGFSRAYEWEENAPVRLDGRLWDTAFVEHDGGGRELDVHAVALAGAEVSLATTDPWDLPPGPLDGVGTIDGRAVPCVTAEAQVAMHRGYELPDKHRADLRRLAEG